MLTPMPEAPAHYAVRSLYQSVPHARDREEGFEVEAAVKASGEVHSLLLMDHGEANAVEMPPEVALAVGWVLTNKLVFEGEAVRLDPPVVVDAKTGAGGEWHVVSIYRSNDNPAFNEAGYQLHAALDDDGLVQAVTMRDTIGNDFVDMPPEIARSMGRALSAFPLFPRASVN